MMPNDEALRIRGFTTSKSTVLPRQTATAATAPALDLASVPPSWRRTTANPAAARSAAGTGSVTAWTISTTSTGGANAGHSAATKNSSRTIAADERQADRTHAASQTAINAGPSGSKITSPQRRIGMRGYADGGRTPETNTSQRRGETTE